MKVSAVTAPDAASDSAHTDHDRWVKERTLQMEIEHAKRLGLPLHAAEAENQRLLERSERIAKDKPQKLTKRKAAPAITPQTSRASRLQRLQERAVTIKAAQPDISPLKLSPCGRCGTCRRCMRERRILAIVEKARAGDRNMLMLAWQITATTLDAKGGAGRFMNMTPEDANRVVIAKAEQVCDMSIRWMGPWL